MDANTNLRTLVRTFIREHVEDLTIARAPDVTKLAIAYLREVDEDAVQRYQDERLHQDVYEDVLTVFGTFRNGRLEGQLLVKGDKSSEDVARQRSKWARWYEHAGKRHIKLMTMTKADLLLAVKERRRNAVAHEQCALLWEKLADVMNDTETVEDRFTPEQIDALDQTILG